MLSQLELEARYAGGGSAATAHFVYADHANEVIERRGLVQEGDIVAKKAPSQMSYFSVMVAMRVSARVAMTLLISVCSVS